MPPCQETQKKNTGDSPINESQNDTATCMVTEIVQPAPGVPAYVRCNSLKHFVNPTTVCNEKSAAEINATELNLNLGQVWLNRERNPNLVKVIRWLSQFLFSWWEHHLFRLWNRVPVAVRRKITFTAWKLYFPIHKWLLGRKTGIHPDVSLEYHALTTVMWGGRYFPVTVPRMRFGLSQLTASHPTPQSSLVEPIDEAAYVVSPDDTLVPNIQKDHCRVKGLYLHHRPSHGEATEYTLFWLYGGAFLAGDAPGNTGPADEIGTGCAMDVFLPTYRLAPEFNIDDLLWDVALAYRWLYLLRQKRGQDPSKILLFGCSSGAALCLRLMQFIAELKRGEELLPSYIAGILKDVVTMPAGAVLASPYVDFQPKDPAGSFLQYSKHDLIVNEPVLEVGLPFLDTHMCDRKVEHSPVHRSLAGLPPLCVVVSEHETVYDESIHLVNAARAAGVPVTIGLWKYMCHVWVFLGGFVPEGQQAMDFICEWYREQQQTSK
jgi:epsilon-lactone hydrolase